MQGIHVPRHMQSLVPKPLRLWMMALWLPLWRRLGCQQCATFCLKPLTLNSKTPIPKQTPLWLGLLCPEAEDLHAEKDVPINENPLQSLAFEEAAVVEAEENDKAFAEPSSSSRPPDAGADPWEFIQE